MRKWYFIAGLAVGYVLGTKAGRERYEQLASIACRVKENDRVQSASRSVKDGAGKAVSAAQDKLKETKLGEKVDDMASRFSTQRDPLDDLTGEDRH